ncbi:MAG: DUF4340 domain-containing protein [Desulfobacula sp.]|nr:DUF4340 domain-containing protein [Desulfobacula sp.]
MKKEYLILIALILLLSAYLIFNKESTDHYTLPRIIEMTPDKITSIAISNKKDTVVLVKKNKQWFIEKENHLANSVAVDNIIDALNGLKLSALVSQKSDLKRYELDDEKKITVKVFEGATPVFEFAMGKTAPTYNHTFIMLGNDTNVYHANGSFRSYFEKSKQDFRDKKVLEFKEKSIKRFTIKKDGLSKTFFAREENKDPAVFWYSKDGLSVDKDAVSNLLSVLSFLECKKFLNQNDKTNLKKETPLCQIELENDTIMTVSLIKSKDQENFSGISSMNEDAFELSAFNGKEIVSNIDTLLGIKKEDNETE